jgi:branched-chain amino acid transport system permease protein
MKDSSAACATLGLNLTVTKMGVFALSTAIAAVGGALYGASEHSVNGQQFQYVFSLLLLLIVYVWGIKTPSGALLGGLVLAFIPLLEVHLPERFRVVSYLGTGIAIVALSRNPNGVMGQVSAAWDKVRTRVAADRGAPAKVASRPREEVATVAAAAN